MITLIFSTVVLLLGAATCLLICVDQHGSGPLSVLRRFVFDTLPEKGERLSNRLLGPKATSFFKGIKHYLIETNHPLVQFFYLLISVGGFAVYDLYGLFTPELGPIAGVNIVIANVLALVSFFTYYKACSVSPGYSCKAELQSQIRQFKDYYEEVLYKRQGKCKTCDLNKPARSKHCSLCGGCVLKQDHHCIWVRQCVGLRNYKWFLAFLLQHAVWCLYLSMLAIYLLLMFIVQNHLFEAQFQIMTELGPQVVPSSPSLVLNYMLFTQLPMIFLALMCLVMGVSLVAFFLYHIYLIYKGQTSRERVKRSDFLEYMEERERFILKELEAKSQKSKEFKKQLQEIRMDRQKLSKNFSRGFLAQLKEVLSA